ncbi:MAG: N(4)-(beta-N-acetylglucosaminyl)-L-asparaginase [Saprospiraceae bacterium]|nr:N(4)-(beta-N-acetylglucosaminyl)-L-asparaginase [Saprospiraceae bacterium]
MPTRRRFFTQAFISSLVIGGGLSGCSTDPGSVGNKGRKKADPADLPAVIATWKTEAAVTKAAETLQQTGSALDAVEAGARVEEADPKNMTVGYGGLPDRDGFVTLDACIMDHQGRAGSVTFLQDIKHPVSVARKVMETTPHVILSGDGALQFALENGFERINLLTPEAEAAWKKWLETEQYKPVVNIERHDTIGLLAIDKNGNISGACTTSGMAYKMHGRVGDSPIIGAGLFVDNEVGGAVGTGLGELVLKTLGSFLIVEFMRQGKSPQEACEAAIQRIIDKYPEVRKEEIQVGFVAIDKTGATGAAAILPGFQYTLHQRGKLTTADNLPGVMK